MMEMLQSKTQIKPSDLLPFKKPDNIDDEVWEEYKESGEHDRFWQLFGSKTVIVTVLITFGVNLILNETVDWMLNNPALHGLRADAIDIGIFIVLIAVVAVFVIDKSEEIHRLQENQKKWQEKQKREAEEARIAEQVECDIENKGLLTREELKPVLREIVKDELYDLRFNNANNNANNSNNNEKEINKEE